MVSFQEGIAVTQKSSHEYGAYFHGNWCIGSVPHGGYITSCFLQVAKEHFSKTLSRQNQPHTITLHLEFVRRTEVGPATFKVRDVKVGRLTSTVHISLFQNGREEVIGYLTNSNIPRADGPSYDTRWRLEPPPQPLGSTAALEAGSDAEWKEQKSMPFSAFRKASQNIRFFFPARGQPAPGVADQWMAFRNGERFTNASLGMVADMFPQIPESFRARSDPYAVGGAGSAAAAAAAKEKSAAKFWYPTLLLNLDVKKALPEEGVDWLFVRTRAKQIRNGRYDLEVVVMDAADDIVALSHHVCMILPAARNLAARNGASKEAKL
ncbi:putative trehalose-phosphate synthase (udp-forming) [Diaporthe eres]|uniref:Thioesterase family protein n=1 Tax=Diaporthe vaccinii TaxID=105482 RepID=A0ABR4E928_9PEZI|nr:putative trehalose-phosphate synthase (udp-forming) [Diaporthe eres]